MTLTYKIGKVLARFLLAVIFRVQIAGTRKLPEGPVIVVSNHISNWDVLILGGVFDRQIHYMAKKELFKNPLLKKLMEALGAFPVDRGGNDMAAMRTCISILKEGGVLGIFPQGHRYKHDENHEMQSGAAFIALRTHVPVVPIHVSGPVRPFRRTTIHIMPPVDLSDLTRPDAPSIGEATKRLSGAIWTSEN